MVRDVYLYRHAQAQHNATSDWSIPDPPLTLLGVSQARDIPTTFSEQFPDALAPTPVLVVSPLRRTIQTAKLGFPSLGKPIFMAELQGEFSKLQQINDLPCDTGSNVDDLREMFPDLDFTGLAEDWNNKKGRWAPEDQPLLERARVARKWLRDRPEEAAVVVSHGDFLRYYLAASSAGKAEQHWENGEGRLYRFAAGEESGDEHAWLVRVRETDGTAQVKKGQEKSQTSGQMADKN